MKILSTIALAILLLGFQSNANPIPKKGNIESSNAQKGGWISLFDGKTKNGWHIYSNDQGNGSCWKVVDGTLAFIPYPDKNSKIRRGGDLVTDNQILEVDTMEITQEQLDALALKSAEEGAKKALEALPVETKNIGNVTVTKDEADQEWANPGEYFKAVKNAAYYPSSEDPRLRSLKATGMSEGVPADGGYLKIGRAHV
jgi:hypothetical protein